MEPHQSSGWEPTVPAREGVTRVLNRMRDGDSSAAAELLPLVYEHLRALAGSYFRGQPAEHTLQPTALVHEAYLKLIGHDDAQWKDHRHVVGVAATVMRQILQDRARRKRAAKRRGDGRGERVTLSGIAGADMGASIDLIALDDALIKLAAFDARHARIVELRFFAGLTVPEVAALLDVSSRTIEKEWRAIRAWLGHELSGRSNGGS